MYTVHITHQRLTMLMCVACILHVHTHVNHKHMQTHCHLLETWLTVDVCGYRHQQHLHCACGGVQSLWLLDTLVICNCCVSPVCSCSTQSRNHSYQIKASSLQNSPWCLFMQIRSKKIFSKTSKGKCHYLTPYNCNEEFRMKWDWGWVMAFPSILEVEYDRTPLKCLA